MAEPAGEFWNVLGVVETVDISGRKATVSDEQGILHPITWIAGYIDEKFTKLKPGYYRKFSGETGKPGVVTAVGYMGKDEPEWVKARYKVLHPSGGSGGRPFQPRNDKAIILQCAYKEACETARRLWTIDPSGGEFEEVAEFNRLMDLALARALKDGTELCKAAGVP